jgi:hypothetical protein
MHDLVVLGILFHFMRKIAYGHNKQAIIVLDDEPKFDYWFPQQVLRAMWHALSRKIRFLDTSQVETTGQQVLAVHISIRANATLIFAPLPVDHRTIVSAASSMARKGPKLNLRPVCTQIAWIVQRHVYCLTGGLFAAYCQGPMTGTRVSDQ